MKDSAKIHGYKITEEHLKIFEKAVEHWQKRLGNFDWEVYCKIEDQDDADLLGCIDTIDSSRAAAVILNKVWKSKPTKEELFNTALHENLEIVLNKIRTMLSQYYSFDVVNEELHIVIHKLEQALKE